MPLFHAVLQIDHHKAQVVQFDVEHSHIQKLHAHTHYTRQHQSGVRTEHEFFSEVCDALSSVTEVLVTGSHTGQAAFRHYVGKHRAALAQKIIGWETVDHPTEAQLLAFAREYFAKYPRMAAAPS